MNTQRTTLFIALMATGTLALGGPIEGTREITLSGAGGSDKKFDNNLFNAQGTYGVYMSPQTLLGVRQSLGIAKRDNENSDWNGTTSGFVDYHYGDKYRPYIGASLGYIYGDGVEETFVGGPEVGLKAYLAPDTFVAFNVEYLFLFDSANDVDSQYDDGAFGYSLGLGFNF
jgi:hypothetical protein